MIRRQWLAASVSGLAAVALPARRALADDCDGRSVETLSDPRALHKVALSFIARDKRWRATWTQGSTHQETLLTGPGEHAHLVLAVPFGTPRFALVDTGAGHELEGRVRVYEPSGKLVRALGLKELLTKKELDRVTRSISHLQWLTGSPSLGRSGTSVELPLVGGRSIIVSLTAPPSP